MAVIDNEMSDPRKYSGHWYIRMNDEPTNINLYLTNIGLVVYKWTEYTQTQAQFEEHTYDKYNSIFFWSKEDAEACLAQYLSISHNTQLKEEWVTNIPSSEERIYILDSLTDVDYSA